MPRVDPKYAVGVHESALWNGTTGTSSGRSLLRVKWLADCLIPFSAPTPLLFITFCGRGRTRVQS